MLSPPIRRRPLSATEIDLIRWRYFLASLSRPLRVLLVLGFFWTVCTAWLPFLALAGENTRLELEARGERATARVREKSIVEFVWYEDDPAGEHLPDIRRVRHDPTLRAVFTDRRGVEYSFEWVADRGVYDRTPLGHPVQLLYLPEDPHVAQFLSDVQGGSYLPRSLPIVMTLCGWAWALSGVIVWTGVRRARTRLRLLEGGALEVGEIVDVFQDEDRKYFVSGSAVVVVRYAFNGPDGVRREGVSIPVHPRLAKRLAPGQRIAVFYDPGNPDVHEADVLEARVPIADAA